MLMFIIMGEATPRPYMFYYNIMLKIGNLKFESPLILAPMAGISDLPYRMINRSFGCGFAFTEMLSATALAYRSKGTMMKLTRPGEDRPLGIQLLGADPEILKRSLDIIPE